MEMHKMQVSKSPSQKALYTAYLLGKGWEPIMEGLIQSSLLYCGMYIYLLPKWFRKKEKKKRDIGVWDIVLLFQFVSMRDLSLPFFFCHRGSVCQSQLLMLHL